MSGRRLAALLASAVLLSVLATRLAPRELVRRASFLARAASHDLPIRRLEGSGAAFDRGYFAFLENVRGALPKGVPGVAIYSPHRTTEALHLASYDLAPTPVLLSPPNVPPRWIAAYHVIPPPEGWRVLARVPGGALVAPP